ncbi:ribose-phosphate diphosphokinase [Sphingopyxis chilensis]
MTAPLLFELKAAPGLAERLCQDYPMERGQLSRRRFPDGESYVRLLTPVAGRDVMALCTLDRPDEVTLSLLFFAAAAREQGARRLGLVAPYLGYMRQDRAFQPGEAVTSATYAALLSNAFDWLATVDPHLHRYPDLSAVYTIPTVAATAAKPIADWIRREVKNPILIGPDVESAQWIERVARLADAPFLVFEKARRGDRDVVVTPRSLESFPGGAPVIVDDIVSSARTMIEAARLVRAAGLGAPVCVGVHAVFAEDAYAALAASGAARVVTVNTVAHSSNEIEIADELHAAIAGMLK